LLLPPFPPAAKAPARGSWASPSHALLVVGAPACALIIVLSLRWYLLSLCEEKGTHPKTQKRNRNPKREGSAPQTTATQDPRPFTLLDPSIVTGEKAHALLSIAAMFLKIGEHGGRYLTQSTESNPAPLGASDAPIPASKGSSLIWGMKRGKEGGRRTSSRRREVSIKANRNKKPFLCLGQPINPPKSLVIS
jgi:hypothetical protein